MTTTAIYLSEIGIEVETAVKNPIRIVNHRFLFITTIGGVRLEALHIVLNCCLPVVSRWFAGAY